MKESYEQQYDLWLKTNYPEQVKQLIAAGLIPLYFIQKGGPGGSTGGSGTSVGGAQAADTAQMQNAHTSQVMTSIALMKAESKLKLTAQ